MANSAELNDWTLANARWLQLEVIRRTWPEEWLPGWHDYQVTISVQDKKHTGRGLATSEEMAFAKASAEAFERASLSGYEVPWATAAYPEYSGAAKRAYWELLGIDRVICHHLCRKRFWNVSLEILADNLPLSQLQAMLSKNKLVLYLYELRPAKDAKTCAAFIWSGDKNHDTKGFVTGFGTSESLEVAANHATIECLRTAIAVFLGKTKPAVTLEQLRQARCPSWHLWMAQSQKAMDYLKQHLIPEGNPLEGKNTEDICEGMVVITRIEQLQALFPGIPLAVVQAKSDKLIKPQFGEPTLDNATTLRLKAFDCKPLSIDLSVPHFYG